MLAYGYVSDLIKNRKIKKRKSFNYSECENREAFSVSQVDSTDLSFSELEDFYKNIVSIIENTPEIRASLVNSLKEFQENGKDLNSLYTTDKIIEEASFKKVLFFTDE